MIAAKREVEVVYENLKKKEKSYPKTPWKAFNDCEEAAYFLGAAFYRVKNHV